MEEEQGRFRKRVVGESHFRMKINCREFEGKEKGFMCSIYIYGEDIWQSDYRELWKASEKYRLKKYLINSIKNFYEGNRACGKEMRLETGINNVTLFIIVAEKVVK